MIGMRAHTLKIDASPLNDLLSGAKTGEVRKDDGGFKVGDTVHLTCVDGRTMQRVISHVQRGYGLPDGICVLSYTHTAAPVEGLEPIEADLQELLERLDAGLEYKGDLETENDYIELFNTEAAQELFADAATAIRSLSSPSPPAQALEEVVPFAPAMIPAKMLLEAKSIQDLLFILGGCDEENPYHDGILWVGTMPDEDGDRYGLHVYSNEYPEEGSITLATFQPAALSSQPLADGRKFQLGDRVTKNKGSSWTGRVVGFYSTELTPVGYAIESETEKGSVQIYPEAALRPLPPAPGASE